MRHVMVPVLLAAAACVAAQHTLAQHSEGVRVAVTKAPANGSTRSETAKLKDFLHYHESTYITVPTATPRHGVSLQISAHGKNFVVDSEPNRALFSKDFTAEYHTKDGVQKIDLDRDRFHVGTVNGVADSVVHTTFRHDGMIDSVIRIGEERYHIEPASRYPGEVDHPTHNHIVFKASHINDEAVQSAGMSCGNHEAKTKGPLHTEQPTPLSDDFLADVAQQESARATVRGRRQAWAGSSGYTDCRSASGNCVCTTSLSPGTAALYADAMFVESAYGEGNPTIAAQYMVNQLAQADVNFRRAYFNGLMGYGMAASTIRIYGDNEGPASTNGNPLTLLESFANKNSDQSACVGHLFTRQDFQGTLGLAYIGTICNSYNYGFHSTYGIGTVVQQLTLTHELGHSWGAEHDPDGSSCAPDNSQGGRYLMYAAATDGSSANNKQFSMCSRSSIASIIDKVGCLTKVAAYCGNGIVEEGEVCDCGVGCAASSCCTSTCQVNTDYGYTCAPQDPIKFPCCTPEDGSLNQCQSISADVKKLCDPASECTLDTYCDGSSSTCPSVITEPDGSECDCYEEDCINHPQTGAKICSSGKCNTWKCSVFGAERCIGDGLSCALSCKGGSFGDGSTCVSTFDKDLRPSTINVTGLYVGEGTTCDEYKGYCSKRGYCYSVGSDLASRWKERGTDFFLAYGWTILAGVLAITLLQVGFRRLYRVKRREGYEALPDMDRRRHREYVIGRGFPPVERRDGFEHWDSDDDESTEDEVNLSGEQEESNMDNLAADYDRQTLQVVFDNFKQRIQRCMVPANLPSIEADIRAYKDDASKLDFSRLQVLELQTAYNDRRCVLLGLPIDPPTKLSVATDAVCTAIDTSRQITQQAIHKTAETRSNLMQRMKEYDKKAEEYIYF